MEIIIIKYNVLNFFSCFLTLFLFFNILPGDKCKRLLCTMSLCVLMSEDSLCAESGSFARFPGRQAWWCHHHCETGGEDARQSLSGHLLRFYWEAFRVKKIGSDLYTELLQTQVGLDREKRVQGKVSIRFYSYFKPSKATSFP